MTDQINYDELLSIFQNMDPTALKFPVIPMGAYLQESADLYAWLQPDKEKLLGAGLDRQLIESLPVRTGAARHAESIWKARRFVKADAQRQYNQESPVAYDLRDTTVHDMLFAYRNYLDVLGRVQQVAEGSGNADMIQDLSDLAVIGRTYPEPLENIKFSFKQLEKADELVKRLSPLLAIATGETSADEEAKLNRDRAYTYLKEAVDEIRTVGRYVFWRDHARLRGYASDYMRKHRGAATVEDIDETLPDETTAATAG